MKETKIDFWGWFLITSLLILLSIAGYSAYKSIDYQVLTKLESQQLILPTETPLQNATLSATTSSPSPTQSPDKK